VLVGGPAPRVDHIPGLCGIVPGSVDPKQMGIEAGLSATGDILVPTSRMTLSPGESMAAAATPIATRGTIDA
jgi:ribulose kinase